MRFFVALLLCSCTYQYPVPPAVAEVGGVCGGVVVGENLLTAAHCVDAGLFPVRTTSGVQWAELLSLDDDLGRDLAWVRAGYPLGPSIDLGPVPVTGLEVQTWLASEQRWVDGKVTSVDHAWHRARLSVLVRHGDSGSPVLRLDGRLACVITGAIPRTRIAECSWPTIAEGVIIPSPP